MSGSEQHRNAYREEARLRKRLRILGMCSYTEYCDYLFSPEGSRNELMHMIDVVISIRYLL